MHDGESLIQNIEYEWVPLRCKTCSSFGHSIENCDSKLVWKEKQSLQEKSEVNCNILPVEGDVIAEKALFDLNNKNDPLSFNDIYGKNMNIEETSIV